MIKESEILEFENPTFWEFLKSSKSNRNGLILQMILALTFLAGLCFDDEISIGWTIAVIIFIILWAILAWYRAHLIYKVLIKSDYFKRERE